MAEVTVETIGSTRGHGGQGPTEVAAFRLSAGRLTATIWSYGATLVELLAPDRDGTVVNVVRSRGRLADHDRPDRGGYPGATIGRYANRIAHGRFVLDGVPYVLATNNGANHLHGGVVGFDQYVWDGSATSTGDGATVAFRHRSPDGDEGYPGTLDVTTRYRLDAESLTITHTATTDAPTIVNLTNHAYWNLAGAGTIDDHVLTLDAVRHLPVDDTQIPTGALVSVSGTRFDLTEPGRLGDHLGPTGIDHSYAIDHTPGKPAATLLDPRSGRMMVVETDQPAIQLYTGDHFHEPRAGLCLETQVHPDTPNQAALGSAVLRPGSVYRHEARHVFSVVGTGAAGGATR